MKKRTFEIYSTTDRIGILQIYVSDFYAKHGHPDYKKPNTARAEERLISMKIYEKDYEDFDCYKMRMEK